MSAHINQWRLILLAYSVDDIAAQRDEWRTRIERLSDAEEALDLEDQIGDWVYLTRHRASGFEHWWTRQSVKAMAREIEGLAKECFRALGVNYDG